MLDEKLPSTPNGTDGLNSELEASSASVGSHLQSKIGSSYPLAKLQKDIEKISNRDEKLHNNSLYLTF